jgi:hypothetical protein
VKIFSPVARQISSPAMENMSAEDVLVFLRESLPSVILALHDISSKRRRESKLTLRALCERANIEPQLQELLVSTTVACLAGASETIRAGVVEALGLYAYALEDCEDLKRRFINIVLLLDNHSPQMARSMVKFLRLAIQGVSDPDLFDQCFQFFLKNILGSSVARSACRVRIRTLIEKIGKKIGWDRLEKMLPEAHMKLFRYTRRMYNRRVRKSIERSAQDGLSDEDDGVNSSDEEVEETMCMFESSSDPVDLASGRIPMMRKRIINKPTDNFKTNDEGKLVIDDEEEAPVKKRVSLSDLAELRQRSEDRKKTAVSNNSSQKASHAVTKRNRRKHELIGLTQFAPKKTNAYGDAKRATTDTDPFAYVRLNPSLVREKYKGNAIQALSQVIRKTGEKAGRKKVSRGRSGIAGNLFVQKPSFKVRKVSRK